MVDFGELKSKAEKLAEEHAGQVDNAIDKAADLLGGKFGHESQVDKGAEKLKDLLPGSGDDDAAAKPKDKRPGDRPGKHAGAHEGKAGPGKGGGKGKGGGGKGAGPR